MNSVSANAKEYNVEHRIAMVGFASKGTDNSAWKNTGLFVDGSLKKYASRWETSSQLSSQDYKDALVVVNDVDGDIAGSISRAIGNLDAEGATRTSYGLEMAQKSLRIIRILSGSAWLCSLLMENLGRAVMKILRRIVR